MTSIDNLVELATLRDWKIAIAGNGNDLMADFDLERALEDIHRIGIYRKECQPNSLHSDASKSGVNTA